MVRTLSPGHQPGFVRPKRLSCARGVLLAMVLIGLVIAPAALGQQADDKSPLPAEAAANPWFNRDFAAIAASAQLTGITNPITVLALRRGGQHNLVWGDNEPERNRVPPLNETLLQSVEDKRPFFDFRAKAPDEIPRTAQEERQVYSQAIIQAHETAPELFAKAAREDDNRHLTFGHLMLEPARYRGKVVHMEGRLKRVRRQDAPLQAREAGIKYVYEGWIFTETLKSNPVVVVFPDLPDGLEPAESMDRNVAFNGYFFKKYLYASGEGNRYTLLFVAPSLILKGPGHAAIEDVQAALPAMLFYIIAGVVTVTIAILILLTLWFRRSDRQLQKRLADVRVARAMEMTFGDMETPPEPTLVTERAGEVEGGERLNLPRDGGLTGNNGARHGSDGGSGGN
jgi:hypothetical protein